MKVLGRRETPRDKAERPAVNGFRRAERRLGFLLIMPTVLVMGGMIIFPFFSAIILSFFRKSPVSPRIVYIGLENYLSIFQSGDYWESFKNGLIWTASTTFLMLVIGVGLALLMHQQFKGRTIVRGLVLFPYMVPTVVACLVWQWLFSDTYGFVNHFLRSIGLIRGSVIWLGDPFWAMVACILVEVWLRMPFVIISTLARLQTIPEELYEAAKIDGASDWQRFWTITLPQLKSVLVIVVLLRFLWTYKTFDVIWLLTRGGPLQSTQNLPVYAYQEAFLSMFMGRGAAISVTIFIQCAILGFLFLHLMERKETGP